MMICGCESNKKQIEKRRKKKEERRKERKNGCGQGRQGTFYIRVGDNGRQTKRSRGLWYEVLVRSTGTKYWYFGLYRVSSTYPDEAERIMTDGRQTQTILYSMNS